jgi:hypothetical protein
MGDLPEAPAEPPPVAVEVPDEDEEVPTGEHSVAAADEPPAVDGPPAAGGDALDAPATPAATPVVHRRTGRPRAIALASLVSFGVAMLRRRRR